jgi:hypothetical protein
MPSGFGCGGAVDGGGAEIGGGGGGVEISGGSGGGRAGRDEGAESSRADTNRLVRGAFGSPSKPSFVQVGSGFSVRPLNFFYHSRRLMVLIYVIFLTITHN